MSAFDGLDDLAAWLDARGELVEEWLSCCEFAPVAEETAAPVVRLARDTGVGEVAAFAGSLFGTDGGQSSGGGSSGRWALAA